MPFSSSTTDSAEPTSETADSPKSAIISAATITNAPSTITTSALGVPAASECGATFVGSKPATITAPFAATTPTSNSTANPATSTAATGLRANCF